MTLADASPGLRVVYVGESAAYRGKSGTVERVVKSDGLVVIRWDKPSGPAVYEQTYRAYAANVRPE